MAALFIPNTLYITTLSTTKEVLSAGAKSYLDHRTVKFGTEQVYSMAVSKGGNGSAGVPASVAVGCSAPLQNFLFFTFVS